MSGLVFTEGMHGPTATIFIRIPRPDGFTQSMVTASKSLTVEIERPGGTLVLGPDVWLWTELRTSRATAVYEAVASDFPFRGIAVVEMSLTLNGVPYALKEKRIPILRG